MTKRVGRDRLLDEATALFRAKGYSATGIDEIVRACGVTKGSLYHHFPTKEALALAAMERVEAHFADVVFAPVTRVEEPGRVELAAMNAAVEAFFLAHPDGCLLANLSLEIGVASEPFRAAIRRFFDDWRACYRAVFAAGRTPEAAAAAAADALAAVHGCVLVQRIDGDVEPLRRLHRRLLDEVRSSV
ncbi:MAG: TetR/AcrR family transcriptional regulator [Hyphomicrobiales bacterium]|nr:TetR/AcrR family transcriptional regulator [Hyphomicrobiales bacterium]